jgi:hypothetical protein
MRQLHICSVDDRKLRLRDPPLCEICVMQAACLLMIFASALVYRDMWCNRPVYIEQYRPDVDG